MNERRITPVSDNIDKARTYAQNIRRYNEAISHEFYYEAMLIVYAIIEDRLRSFLYHAGALKNRDSYKIDSSKAKKHLKGVVSQYKTKNESSGLGINSIAGKMKVIRCLLKWVTDNEYTPQKGSYLWAVKDHIKSMVDVGGMLECLEEIARWCEYRNEVIHALLNKNMDSLNSELAEQVKNGMHLARYLDLQVRQLKSKNIIRRRLNLPIEK